MCDIVGIMNSWTNTDGDLCAKVDLQVSEVSELPEKDAAVGGFKVQPGSIAQIIQSDAFVTLDSDGTWYPEQS